MSLVYMYIYVCVCGGGVKHVLRVRACSESTAFTYGHGDNPHDIRECGYQVLFRVNIQVGGVRDVIVGPLLCCV